VLLEISRLFPQAPIYTSLYDPKVYDGAFAGADIRTTWLARIPGATKRFRALLPLYPKAFESLDLSGFDLIVSSTTSFAKGVIARPGTLHVCYMNAPTRFLWSTQEYSSGVVPRALRPLYRAWLPTLRRWDLAAAARPHRIIANSHNVARSIREAYGRDADVLHCPAAVDGFAASNAIDDYYVVAARLLPYKRVDLAIEACALAGVPLRIIGTGPELARLRRLAGDRVRFMGTVSDAERARLFARARAIIVPGTEDFGLVPIEANAAGRPVVAYAAGGALETIVEGETGAFFREPTARSLADVLASLRLESFDPQRLAAHAQTFSPDRFRHGLRTLLDGYWSDFHARDAHAQPALR